MSCVTQVRGCTPLVMWEIGISSRGREGQILCHMERETTPCSRLTALLNADIRRASTVRQKSSPSLFGSSRPRARNSRQDSPSSRAIAPKYFSIRPGAKRSFPAGTGVWVVKTFVDHTHCHASSNDSLSRAISARIRSSPRNAEWPSFMCMQAAVIPSAFRARMPPMPRRISCWMRISRSPPYNEAVISRSGSGFASMFASSRYRKFFPTATFHIQAVASAGPISTVTVNGAPFASRQRVTGMLYQSFSGYDSCWKPSTFRYC